MTLRNAQPSEAKWYAKKAVVGSLLFVAVACAWANTLNAPFVFDDTSSILENKSIRALGTLDWLNPPNTAGETVAGRPVLNFTFALNYAISGLDGWSYHALNSVLHALTAFGLWAVLRRLRPRDDGIALVATLLWAVHPLQTAAVSYVAQRAELLAALCIVLTLYCYIRYATGGPARLGWSVLCVAAALAGIGTKETAAVAPLLVLLVGGTILTTSFGEAWRKHRRLYLTLLATWIPLGILVWSTRGRGGSAGFNTAVNVTSYAATQAWAILHYLRLAVWPVGQTFDYGMPLVTDLRDVLVPCALVCGLLIATIWALLKRQPAGTAGAAFFLLLAPTSSFLPIATQTVAEHRVYLALAVPLLLLTGITSAFFRRVRWPASFQLGVAGIAIGGLASVTIVRNRIYQSPLALWTDTVAHRPDNARAHYNLGLAQLAEGRREDAARQFEDAVALQPTHAFAQFQLGVLAMTSGNLPQAQMRFATALLADPQYLDARVNLARTLGTLNRTQEAIAEYRAALAQVAQGAAADIRAGLAGQLIQIGAFAEAGQLLDQALADSPDLTEAHYYRARLYEKAGDSRLAEKEFRTTLNLHPGFVPAAAALGNLLGRQGRFEEAIEVYRVAVLGEPNNYQARNNLANCYLALHRVSEAIAEYQLILKMRPNDSSVRKNLEIAREILGPR